MKIIKDFILRNIAGEYVLIPTGTTTQEFNGLISLNEIAALYGIILKMLMMLMVW